MKLSLNIITLNFLSLFILSYGKIHAQINYSLDEHIILKNFNNGCSISGADLNNDGYMDFVATSFDGHYISWFENDNKQNFTEHLVIDNFGNACVIDIAYIDDDDDYDLVATAQSDNKISWFENDGNGNFFEHVVVENWTASGFVMARNHFENFDIDFDKDGDTDLLATSEAPGNRVSWFENDGNQNFTEHIIKENWYWARYCTVCDIDKDNDLDIVGTAKSGEIIFFENDGNQNFTENIVIANWGEPSSVQAADIDEDGDIDLAGTSVTAQEVAWFENDGNQNFEKHTIRSGFNGAFSVTIVDIDDDDDLDIAAIAWIDGLISVFENDGNENFTEYLFCDHAYDMIKIFSIDLDLDGDQDILGVCYSEDDLRWWENSLYKCDFKADLRTGHMPLNVQFSDASNTNQSITAWSWDFENDGIFDSFIQNPVFEYSNPGIYSVRLVITIDTLVYTMLKENYIKVFDGKSAIKFNNNDDYVYFPVIPLYNITDNFTIEIVTNPLEWGNPQFGSTIFDKSSIRLFIIGNAYGLMGDYTLGADLLLSDSTSVRLSAPDSMLTLNNWRHIAVSYNSLSSQFKMYINGLDYPVRVIGANQPSGELLDNENVPINIGNDLDLIFGYTGVLDEFRLWEVVRSESEILENMDNDLIGNEPGLIGYWQMDEGNGTELIDSSTTRNNGQIISAVYTQGVDLSTITDVNQEKNESIVLKNFILHQNFPNPFNPITNIKYQIPELSFVTVKVFDVLGNEIETLVNEQKQAGTYEITWYAEGLPSGVYFYRLQAVPTGRQAGDFIETKKMVLTK